MALFCYFKIFMYMGVKMIITERQYNLLRERINESTVYENMINTMVSDLSKNYKPMVAAIREDGEYRDIPMFEVIVDGNQISAKDLFEYMKKKYSTSDEFTQQVIKDWAFGTLKGNRLSKNVSMN